MSKEYLNKDTIVSLSSGIEKSAIAIIRLSGNDCFKIASKFIEPSKMFENIKPNITYMAKILDEKKQLLDKVIVIPYLAPKSFTGENMLEIFCHGSPYIVRNIINLAIKNSARQAMPGEFSFRAFLNGKIDLAQAEALNDLIKAETKQEHNAAIRQVEGLLSKKIQNIKQKLIDLLSELEVRIDDSYEEMENINFDSFKEEIVKLEKTINELSNTFYSGKYIKDGIRIAIVGMPNSGKSSLLNAILGYNRAIVSPLPGTTRDTIEEKIELNGFKVTFIDTAGIRTKTNNIVEKEGIERTKESIKKADIILFLKDISKPESKGESFIKDLILENKKTDSSVINVFTKSDLPHSRKASDKDILISSVTGQGIEKLKKQILKAEIFQNKIQEGEIITSARHFQCLKNAANYIEKTIELIKEKDFKEYELAAENLRYSLDAISEIAGETTSEDILKNIFSNFCVGK